jgi:hypothetical protein
MVGYWPKHVAVVINFVVIHVDVCSHTQHTLLRSFITGQLVSTPNIGHHQAIIQEHECIQELNTTKLEISHFYIKSTFKTYVKFRRVYKGIFNYERRKDI